MSDSRAQLPDLDALRDEHKAQDDERNLLIERLFTHIEDLSKRCAKAENDLQDKNVVITWTRGEVEKLEASVSALQLERFQDDLVKKGLAGGKSAAALLSKAVADKLQSLDSATYGTLRIVVRVYANLKGLAKTYTEAGFPRETLVSDFVRGFNMGNVTCDYIDAGDGKECSDVKLKDHLASDLTNMHCQQIVFGASADNGYARVLAPLTEDKAKCKRITLLEGPPFARELADIKHNFNTMSIENVFRSQKLVNPKHAASPRPSNPGLAPDNYATAVKASSSQSTGLPLPAQQVIAGPERPATIGVLTNELGQRIDSPLKYSPQEFASIKSRKLCNKYYLLGHCWHEQNRGICPHDHTAKLTKTQMTALRAVARQSACQIGLSCNDPQCIGGHRCSRDNCVQEKCWFAAEMHDVDTRIVLQS